MRKIFVTPETPTGIVKNHQSEQLNNIHVIPDVRVYIITPIIAGGIIRLHGEMQKRAVLKKSRTIEIASQHSVMHYQHLLVVADCSNLPENVEQ